MKFNFLEVHRIWTRVKGQHFRYWPGFIYISSLKYGSALMLIANLGTVLCYSLKIETSVLICLANLIIFWETLAMTKKWMRERWIARFVDYFNCSLVSYPILSEGSFSAAVPSSSSEELASFSCQKKYLFLPVRYHCAKLKTQFTVYWIIFDISCKMQSHLGRYYLRKQGMLRTSYLLVFSCHLKLKKKKI